MAAKLGIGGATLVGGLRTAWSAETPEPAADLKGMKAASKAFYAALAVIDNGEAMEKVWAHAPYVTYVGPRSKSIIVGWDALKKYFVEINRLFSQRNVTL
jgi:hypothetical protein